MKNLVVLGLFIMMLILAQVTKAQTVDDIAKLNVEAMGGADKLMALKSVKLEGTMNAQGYDVTLVTTKSHLKGLRVDIEVMGTSNYQVANPTEGWVFMPVMGMSSPVKMEQDQLNAAINQMDLQGTFLNYKEKGTTIELAGKENVAGSEAYKLNVTYKNGQKTTIFIDTKTNRVVKTVSKVTANGQEMEVESSMSDYKQNADGYWFPYSTTSQQGTITYDKISTNLPVEDSLFKN